MGRVWAVALNALGEVYYLKQVPTPPTSRPKGHEIVRDAWLAGRTAYWDLLGATRRQAHPDDFDRNATRGAYSPRSPCNAMGLSQEQICAEAQEIEKFLRFKPSHFRKVCEGWDMRRRLEVDFASGEDGSSGEVIFVITCGCDKTLPAEVQRYTRHIESDLSASVPASRPSASEGRVQSVFGGLGTPAAVKQAASAPPSGNASPPQVSKRVDASQDSAKEVMDDWAVTPFAMANHRTAEITASAVDRSQFATLSWFEDPLRGDSKSKAGREVSTPTSKHRTGEVPGRRARLLAIGTNTGSILLWNMREISSAEVYPLRMVQTESPKISCLALSALYLVHGGSDGLVQAWDPLASTLDPIRTLNSRSSGRPPRHILNTTPALQHVEYGAVRAIFLDPDATILRGVLSFGSFVRYWSYSSTIETAGRKRRLRHSDIHGRLASRRQGGVVSSYIAAEAAELRHEQDHRNRETARLRNRFGVGLGLSEEEAIRYAEMMSQQSFLDEQRRLSASDTGSAADMGDASSTSGTTTSAETLTPEPSVSGLGIQGGRGIQTASSPPVGQDGTTDDEYELQIQRALRLSLLEGVNDLGQSPASAGEYDYKVKYKTAKGNKRSPSSSPVAGEGSGGGPTESTGADGMFVHLRHGVDEDDDLALALQLSLQENEDGHGGAGRAVGATEAEFPPLEGRAKGKGKSKGRHA